MFSKTFELPCAACRMVLAIRLVAVRWQRAKHKARHANTAEHTENLFECESSFDAILNFSFSFRRSITSANGTKYRTKIEFPKLITTLSRQWFRIADGQFSMDVRTKTLACAFDQKRIRFPRNHTFEAHKTARRVAAVLDAEILSSKQHFMLPAYARTHANASWMSVAILNVRRRTESMRAGTTYEPNAIGTPHDKVSTTQGERWNGTTTCGSEERPNNWNVWWVAVNRHKE